MAVTCWECDIKLTDENSRRNGFISYNSNNITGLACDDCLDDMEECRRNGENPQHGDIAFKRQIQSVFWVDMETFQRYWVAAAIVFGRTGCRF